MITLARMIECVEREIKQRKRVYVRLVAQGRMPQVTATEEIAVMQAVLENLKAQETRLI